QWCLQTSPGREHAAGLRGARAGPAAAAEIDGDAGQAMRTKIPVQRRTALENQNRGSKLIGRRHALQVIGIGAAGLMAACSDWKRKSDEGSQQQAGGGGTCMEKDPGDDAAQQLRKNLQYKEKTDNPVKRCNLCVQFEPNKYGECGACKLFKGAVNPVGVCLSF